MLPQASSSERNTQDRCGESVQGEPGLRRKKPQKEKAIRKAKTLPRMNTGDRGSGKSKILNYRGRRGTQRRIGRAKSQGPRAKSQWLEASS
jgi:hypothetical protein